MTFEGLTGATTSASPETPTSVPGGTQSTIEDLLDGRVSHLFSSFEGTGQYSQGASSGCGLAALNAVRVVLGREKAGLTGLALLSYLAGKEIIDEIIAICVKWSNRLHLEANEIARLPLFESCLVLDDEKFSEATPGYIEHMLAYLKRTSENYIQSSVAVVITRPPEIFTVFYIPLMDSGCSTGEGVFAVFDSHPRPAFGTTGSSFILFSKIQPARNYIFSLMQVDGGLLLEGMGWQGQLLSQFSALHFSIRDEYTIDADPKSLIYDSNLEILQLRHTVQELKNTKRELSNEVITLQNLLQAQASSPCSQVPDSPPGSLSLWSDWLPPLNYYSFKGKEKSSSYTKPNISSASWGGRPGPGQSTTANANARRDATDSEIMDDSRVARRIQAEYDRERIDLHAQTLALIQQAVQGTFECSICFERHSYDSIALVEACGHEMCRECAHGYLNVKLEEGRYPIICPMCQTAKNVKEPGVITRNLIEQLALSEEQVEVWYELELSEHSIILDCPCCRRSSFVDLGDHARMKLLTCPLPDCHGSWCKDCSQSIAPGNAVHSCDGSKELANLMRDSGWMYCPGCQTPTEKFTGCNHITCIAKGCNMHYCYRCHQPIVRSAIGGVIQKAISKHYASCVLFEHQTIE